MTAQITEHDQAPIDITRERLIPIPKVPQFLKERGARSVSRASVYRWCLRGIRDRKLAYTRIGAVLHTSAEALNRFAAEVTKAMESEE